MKKNKKKVCQDLTNVDKYVIIIYKQNVLIGDTL